MFHIHYGVDDDLNLTLEVRHVYNPQDAVEREHVSVRSLPGTMMLGDVSSTLVRIRTQYETETTNDQALAYSSQAECREACAIRLRTIVKKVLFTFMYSR